VNAASQGHGGFARGGGHGQGGHGCQNNQRGRGRGGASARGCGNFNNTSQRGGGRGGHNNNNHRALPSDGDERPLYQVCFKLGHTADRCWDRFHENYVPGAKLVAAATNSYTIDTNWYTDTGATDHITGELEKLSFRNKYNGRDQIHMASGAGMNITHIGYNIVRTPNHDIHLKNVLMFPKQQRILFLFIN
jgi:histone deacetylase 1/2